MIWSPATPGVAFKDIPGAPAPADTRAARLKQMKGLADRFKVSVDRLEGGQIGPRGTAPATSTALPS